MSAEEGGIRASGGIQNNVRRKQAQQEKDFAKRKGLVSGMACAYMKRQKRTWVFPGAARRLPGTGGDEAGEG